MVGDVGTRGFDAISRSPGYPRGASASRDPQAKTVQNIEGMDVMPHSVDQRLASSPSSKWLKYGPDDAAGLLSEARRVVAAEIAALSLVRDGFDDRMLLAVEQVVACRGRVVLVGTGKSAIVAHKVAATLCSLGTPAYHLHGGDALHGDLGAITSDDVVIAISVSGLTPEIVATAAHSKRLGARLVVLSADGEAPLAQLAHILLPIPVVPEEGCAVGVAPLASTIAALALGDALAVLVSRRRQVSRGQLAILHPAGAIGQRLRPVRQIMHGGERIPLVAKDADIDAVVAEIGAKGFGITGVIDPETHGLLGAITDGDLRRHFGEPGSRRAAEMMHVSPVVMTEDGDVEQALALMREHRLSALFIVERESGRAIGLIHIQDLLRFGAALLHG